MMIGTGNLMLFKHFFGGGSVGQNVVKIRKNCGNLLEYISKYSFFFNHGIQLRYKIEI